MSWDLDHAQTQALRDLRRSRQLRLLGEVLDLVIPELRERLGDRFGGLLGLAAQRGAAFELGHLAALGRYLACWCLLGVEFELRDEHVWALDILRRPGLSQGIRVFQLCVGAVERARASAQVSIVAAAQFDDVLAKLDAQLAHRGDLDDLRKPWVLSLGSPCDIDRVTAQLLEVPDLLVYRLAAQGATRVPPKPTPTRCEFDGRATPRESTGGIKSDVQAWPDEITVLAVLPRHGQATQLAIACSFEHQCDPFRHPLIRHFGATAIHERRGDETRLLRLSFLASADSLPDSPSGQPGLAIEGSPLRQALELGGCGLRLSGEPYGSRRTRVAVYPLSQQLLEFRRSARAMLRLPDPQGLPLAPLTQCDWQQDGQARDARFWREGLDVLDSEWLKALQCLQGEWEHCNGLEGSTLMDASGFLLGRAALTWGWSHGVRGLAGPATMRIAALLSLIAAKVDLRLLGRVQHLGAMCDLELRFEGQVGLEADWERRPEDVDLGKATQSLSCALDIAGRLLAVPLAHQSGTLDCRLRVPPRLMLQAGLFQRRDGPGLQWRVHLKLESVQACFDWHDPAMGSQSIQRELLPETTLLDWSLP